MGSDQKDASVDESGFKNYRKTAIQPMRPYIPGEDLTGISVSDQDTPAEGGMIAVNPDNADDKWYVAEEFYKANYGEVIEIDAPVLELAGGADTIEARCSAAISLVDRFAEDANVAKALNYLHAAANSAVSVDIPDPDE